MKEIIEEFVPKCHGKTELKNDLHTIFCNKECSVENCGFRFAHRVSCNHYIHDTGEL